MRAESRRLEKKWFLELVLDVLKGVRLDGSHFRFGRCARMDVSERSRFPTWDSHVSNRGTNGSRLQFRGYPYSPKRYAPEKIRPLEPVLLRSGELSFPLDATALLVAGSDA